MLLISLFFCTNSAVCKLPGSANSLHPQGNSSYVQQTTQLVSTALLQSCHSVSQCTFSVEYKGTGARYLKCLSTHSDAAPTACLDQLNMVLKTAVQTGSKPCFKENSFPCGSNKACIDNNGLLLAQLCQLRHFSEKVPAASRQLDTPVVSAMKMDETLSACGISNTCGGEGPANTLRCLAAHSVNVTSMDCKALVLEKLSAAASQAAAPCKQEAQTFCKNQKACLDTNSKTLGNACQLRYTYGGPTELKKYRHSKK